MHISICHYVQSTSFFKVHSNIYDSLPLLLLGDSNRVFLGLPSLGILERKESIPGDIDSVDRKESVLKRNKLQKTRDDQQ